MAENPRIEELRRRVQADPASIAFAALAEEFRRVGRYDEAVNTCRTGLQRHPAYLSARVTLGRALIETGDFDAAREELETVLRSAPENLAATRGLAQIHERLGHSAEMDPHLAEMMKTMHAESIRVAAAPPPAPPPPAPPELELSLAPQPDPEPEPVLSLGPQLDPEPEPERGFSMAPEPPRSAEPFDAAQGRPATDPFAGFAPMSKALPVHDFSFDLAINAAPPMDLSMAPVAEPVVEPLVGNIFEPIFPPVAERQAEAPIEPIALVVDAPFHLQHMPEPAPEPAPEPYQPYHEPDSEPVLQLHPEPVLRVEEPPVQSAVELPDPEVLATLARLERFLGAIQSSRA